MREEFAAVFAHFSRRRSAWQAPQERQRGWRPYQMERSDIPPSGKKKWACYGDLAPGTSASCIELALRPSAVAFTSWNISFAIPQGKNPSAARPGSLCLGSLARLSGRTNRLWGTAQVQQKTTPKRLDYSAWFSYIYTIQNNRHATC